MSVGAKLANPTLETSCRRPLCVEGLREFGSFLQVVTCVYSGSRSSWCSAKGMSKPAQMRRPSAARVGYLMRIRDHLATHDHSFLLAALVAAFQCHAAPFENLLFENANTTRLSYDPTTGITSGSVNDLLPGWHVVDSTDSPLTQIPFNQPLSALSVIEPAFDPDAGTVFQMLGHFSLLAKDWPESFSLVQRGDVPANATAMVVQGFANNIGVTLDGKSPPVAWVWPENPYAPGFAGLVAIPIEEFAGKNVELRVVFTPIPFSGHAKVDGIYFIPEPPVIGLLVIGLGLLIVSVARRHRR